MATDTLISKNKDPVIKVVETLKLSPCLHNLEIPFGKDSVLAPRKKSSICSKYLGFVDYSIQIFTNGESLEKIWKYTPLPTVCLDYSIFFIFHINISF